jgi:ADP-heptose:LPS heptosyltransferase
MAPSDVFIFRIGNLGDTLVALPAVRRISELHPGARLWLITNEPSAGWVSAWDVLQHTRLFQSPLFYDSSRPQQLLRLALQCRRRGADTLYYLSPPRSRSQLRRDRIFFHWACGFRQIVGLAEHDGQSARDEHGLLRVLPRESDRLLQSVDSAVKVPPPPHLFPPSSAVKRAEDCLAPLLGRPIIALGPGSKMPAKKWFLERYIALCKRVVQRAPEIGFAVFGGPADREEGEALLSALGTPYTANLAGTTDIIESAAALQQCSLYLGNDTGTMHLAAAVGVPCVAVFTSRENRDSWHPLGDAHVILRRDLPCSGCMLERCEIERMRCLDLITVEDVWAALEPRIAALSRTGRASGVLS